MYRKNPQFPQAPQNSIFTRIRDPQTVKILIFVNQQVTGRDFTFISNCRNLIRLDLSRNMIVGMPRNAHLEQMPSLRVLLLHDNAIGKLYGLKQVVECKQLEYLTMWGNPINSTCPTLRHYLVNELTKLKLLDEHVVVYQYRAFDFVVGTVPCSSSTFLKFPIVDLSKVGSTMEYITKTGVERKIYMQKWLKCNPVVRLQRWFRKQIKMRRLALRKHQKAYKYQYRLKSEKTEERVESAEKVEKYHNLVMHIRNENKVKEKYKPYAIIFRILKANFELFPIFLSLLRNSLIISREFYNYLQQYQHLLYNTKIISTRYRFIRLGKSNKSRLNLILRTLMNSIVVKKPKQVSRHRLIKVRLPTYFRRTFGKITYQDKNKIYKCEKMLNLLDYSYAKNVVVLQGDNQQLIKIIKEWMRRRSYNDNYCCILPSMIDRVAAATKIQSLWRGHKVRKQFNTVYQLTRMHAAYRIQYWIRSHSFYALQKFYRYVKDDIAGHLPNKIILHMNIYRCLQWWDKRYSKLLALPLQKMPLLSDGREVKLLSTLRWKLLPSHLLPSNSDMFQVSLPDDIGSGMLQPANIHSILHVGATVCLQGSYIIFGYSDESTTKLRRILLAWKTYVPKLHFYIRCLNVLKKTDRQEYEDNAVKLFKIEMDSRNLPKMSKSLLTPYDKGIFIKKQFYDLLSKKDKRTIFRKQTALKYLSGKAIFIENFTYAWYEDKIDETIKSQSILRIDNSVTSIYNETIPTNMATMPTQKHTIMTQLGGSLQISNKVRELEKFVTGAHSNRYSKNSATLSQSKSQAISSEISFYDSLEKRLKVSESRHKKEALRTERIMQREQLLKSLKYRQLYEQLQIEKYLYIQKIKRQIYANKKHDHIYQRLDCSANVEDRNFYKNFVNRGNFAIRYEFMAKVKTALQQLEKPKVSLHKKNKSELPKYPPEEHEKKNNKRHEVTEELKKYRLIREEAARIEIARTRRNKKQLVHSVFPEEFYPLREETEGSMDQVSSIFPRLGRKG